MFNNIGGKIKGLAKVFCWLGIITCIIMGAIMCIDDDTVLFGILYMLIGSLLSWIGSFLLYGFGELIATTMHISYLVDKQTSQLHTNYIQTQRKEETHSTWKCVKCGQENSNISAQCKGCGQYRT